MESTASHPRALDRDHALAMATLVLGAAALVLLSVSHVAAAWTGLVVVFLGGWSQLISRTRPERFENVIGATAGALALAIGLAQGGLL
jgi:heme O synthase-like polyprenyltransferase